MVNQVMFDDILIDVEMLLGSKRLVMVERLEPDGSLLMGGYSIDYDRHGNEQRRTEVIWNCRVTNFASCMPEMAHTYRAGENKEKQ